MNCLYSQAAAPVFLSSVHLFRVDLNVVCVRTLVDLIGKGGPNLLVPSGLIESIPSPRFVPLCDGFRFRFCALDCEEATSSLL